MIIALYSDQVIAENAAMDRRLAEIVARRGDRIGYITSGPDPDRRFFLEKQRYYEPYGLRLDPFIDLDRVTGDELSRLMDCDAIHLSGGHTPGFLNRLRRSDMMPRLRAHAASGHVLIGSSAGAILMTPTIAVDALFSGGTPASVRDGNALGLLPFEFFPHLNWETPFLPALQRYSETIANPIVACRDGEGLIVEGNSVHVFGSPLVVARGAVAPVDPGRLAALLS